MVVVAVVAAVVAPLSADGVATAIVIVMHDHVHETFAEAPGAVDRRVPCIHNLRSLKLDAWRRGGLGTRSDCKHQSACDDKPGHRKKKE